MAAPVLVGVGITDDGFESVQQGHFTFGDGR